MSYSEAKDKTKGQGQPSQGEFAPVIDDLYRKKVLEARQMSPEDKFLAGERLFILECEVKLAEIRKENPDATEGECLKILNKKLRLEEQ